MKEDSEFTRQGGMVLGGEERGVSRPRKSLDKGHASLLTPESTLTS